MTKEIVVFALSLIVVAIAIYGLRFFKPSKEPKDQGFTDQITEGDGVYVGFVDKARPDMYIRDGGGRGFWGDKYTPIWLKRKKKEEKEEPEKDQRRA